MNSEAIPLEARFLISKFLRKRPIAPLEVLDVLYMKAMGGSVSAQIAYMSAWRREQRRRKH